MSKIGAQVVGGQDPHQAAHVLQGFRYQLLQSVQAWLDLRGDEELWLERSEDFSIVSTERTEDVQVKHSDASGGPTPISLRTAGVRQAVSRYWERSGGGQDSKPQLVFLATSGAAKERGMSFPGDAPGLVYWGAAAGNGVTKPLRRALATVFDGEPLGDWIQGDPTDEDLRARLLARVRFCLGAAGQRQLERHIVGQVGALYLSKNHYASTAEQCVPKLLARVLEAACNPDEGERRLTLVDLHLALEQSLPRIGGLVASAPEPVSLGAGAAVSSLEVREDLVNRQTTIGEIRAKTAEMPVLWVQGGNGVGKSTLATLLASHYGGLWLTCDLRPYSGDDGARGAIPVWHELVSAIALSESLPTGVILDDISPRSVDLLRNRIAGLAEALRARGAKLFVVSNHSPSDALLHDLGVSREALVDAPYFSIDDVRELVVKDRAPPAKQVESWTQLIWMTTACGHPLLTMAKISNLRSRRWPKEALTEDIGPETSEAITLTRSEARKRLLAELPSPEARHLLERASTVFGSVEDGLIFEICECEPRVPHAGDALALLKGSWIEPAPLGGWRVSPLLADLQKDAPADQAIQWRQRASEYWLKSKSLDARTLPACFWNAYMGRQLLVLAKLCQSILSLPSGQLQSAAAMLSPMVALPTDTSLVPEEPMTATSLRLLQISIADAVEDEQVASNAARTLLDELAEVPVVEFRSLMRFTSAWCVLLTQRVRILPETQLAYLSHLANEGVQGNPNLSADTQRLLSGLGEGVDLRGFLFAHSLLHIRDATELEATIDALDKLDPAERTNLIDTAKAALSEVGGFVHVGWAKEQTEGNELSPVLARYERMQKTVSTWKRKDLDIDFVIAKSVILDEGLNDSDHSLTIIDSGIKKFGAKPELIRQKFKVLTHRGEDQTASALLVGIEAELDRYPPFDRALAFRDGAVACASADRLDDAARLFRKSRTSLESGDTRPGLRAGLRVEEALVAWARDERRSALSALADAFETLEGIEPEASRQNQRAHRFGRAALGLFLHDLEPFPEAPQPTIAFGAASTLEADGEPEALDLKSLSDNWRLLEVAEIRSGVDASVAARSKIRQTGFRTLGIELMLACARYAEAVRRREISEALVMGQNAASIIGVMQRTKSSGGAALKKLSAGDLRQEAIDSLCEQGLKEVLQTMLADILLAHALDGLWGDEMERQLEAAVRGLWKGQDLLQRLRKASSGAYAIGSDAPLALVICSHLRTFSDEDALTPRERFARDLYLVAHAAASTARPALEPRCVDRLARGWRFVLEKQRFALNNPQTHAPEIEEAVRSLSHMGFRGSRALFDAAAPAVGGALSPQWIDYLSRIEKGGSKVSTQSSHDVRPSP